MEEEVEEIKTLPGAIDSNAFFVSMVCGVGLAVALWVAPTFYSINLVSDISSALRLIWVIECPIVIFLYNHYRRDAEQSSYLRAVGQGLLRLPVGAIVNSFGAIVLGAPVGIQYLEKTINWGLMMSLFTIVPAACVFGTLWADWQRLFAHTKPSGFIEYMICLPAQGEQSSMLGLVLGLALGLCHLIGKGHGHGHGRSLHVSLKQWRICVSYARWPDTLPEFTASLASHLLSQRTQPVKRD